MAGHTYRLSVVNNSEDFVDLCVFQGPGDPRPVAWLVEPAWPSTTATFTWAEDYDFVWSETGELAPGTVIGASQVWPADPQDTTKNQILLDYAEGAFTFREGTATDDPQPGCLYIRVLGTVPEGVASVGIGMAGAAATVLPARPNVDMEFFCYSMYWVTAGKFTQGQVFSGAALTELAQVTFGSDRAMTATLGPDKKWTVSPAG